MTWALRRQIFYVAVILAFFLVFGFLIVYPHLNKVSTCSDFKQNGDETGVDCGGLCQRACIFETDKIAVLWSRAFQVIPGRFNAVAYIEMDDKRAFLERLIDENNASKVLVFVRTKVRAERVKLAMERVQINAATIHSDKLQHERAKTMDDFRLGELKLLIATDISARGIDIPDVDIVVNYDLPEVAENYVHRVGRTGRGDKKGLAISFCSAEEKDLLEEIETFLDQKITVMELEKSDYRNIIDFTRDTD